MRKADIFVAAFLFVIGVIVLVDSIRLGFGWGVSGPEAGFFPFSLSVGILICTAIIGIKAIRKHGKEGPGKRLIPEGGLKPILWVLLPSIGMVILTEFIGIHLAALVFLAFYMRAVGKIGWGKVALVSILVPMALYVVFDKLFLIPLPQGIWGGKLIPF